MKNLILLLSIAFTYSCSSKQEIKPIKDKDLNLVDSLVKVTNYEYDNTEREKFINHEERVEKALWLLNAANESRIEYLSVYENNMKR
jgi:hypothetical protein